MTCIVAIETRSGVVMGSDSFVGAGKYGADVTAAPKIFQRGGWLCGVAGSTRVANLLEHTLKWPRASPSATERDAIVAVRAMTKLLAKDEFCVENEDGRNSLYSEVIIAAGGRAYVVGGDLSVHRSAHGYIAVGCGAPIALGALAVLPATMPARERAMLALDAAARHSSGVRGPFHLLGCA